ncbi:MAG TPA: hypothetical protein PLF13_14685, partial [candidate division Zixibacteria bacterium]|nr:hypothetical protein [candidate division Zixibacteria bacterium]
WKIDPEFFDFILDVLIDLVVMFLNKGLWKTEMNVIAVSQQRLEERDVRHKNVFLKTTLIDNKDSNS